MKRFLKRALAKFGYQVESTRYIPSQLLDAKYLRPLELADLICRRMVEHGQDFRFIQVGAYDGISTDPLCKYVGRYGWRGVMLEPQPRPVERLRELYAGNDRLVILQAALDSERRIRTLYTVESERAPVWVGGMASFERGHIVKHAYLIPGLEEMIREIEVNCILFDDVLNHLPSDRIDLLQIDAEGYDARILSLFPFERVKPAIIHWEIKNLSKSEQEGCLALLLEYGYRFSRSGGEDMMAVLPD